MRGQPDEGWPFFRLGVQGFDSVELERFDQESGFKVKSGCAFEDLDGPVAEFFFAADHGLGRFNASALVLVCGDQDGLVERDGGAEEDAGSVADVGCGVAGVGIDEDG